MEQIVLSTTNHYFTNIGEKQVVPTDTSTLVVTDLA
jgi:hypothetical protein